MSVLEEISGRVFNVQNYSIRDGRGIRTVLFLKGCPARCTWCCNPESQRAAFDLYHVGRFCTGCGACAARCERGAISLVDGKASIDRSKCIECFSCVKACRADAMQQMGFTMTVAEALHVIMRDAAMYETTGGGFTLSGGEALMQPEFSLALIKEARANGIGGWVETCGVCRREVLVEAAELCSGVYMDLKVMDSERSRRYVGYASEPIKENAAAIAHLPWVQFRLPLIPGITDTEDNLIELAALLKGMGRSDIKVVPYHKLGVDKYRRLGRAYEYEGDGAGVDTAVERAREVLAGLEIETSLA